MSSMIEYKGYHASIEFDADDNLFVGEVFGISDSLNFHGFTVDELKQSFEECIDNYLELCQKIGKNPDKEFKGTFNVRITPELHKQAALRAQKEKITLNQLVSKSINYYINQRGKEKKEIIMYIPQIKSNIELQEDNNTTWKIYSNEIEIPVKEGISYVTN